MKRNFVNLLPDINWEKEDVVLYTSSGIEHAAKTKKQLSKHYLTVEQQYSPTGYYIQDCGDYLAIMAFQIRGNMARVSDFKEAIENDRVPHLEPYHCYWNGYKVNLRTQLRLYKDRSYILVHQVTINNNLITYVNNDDDVNISWDENDLNSETNQTILHGDAIKLINDDKEIYKLRRKVTKRALSIIARSFPAYSDDLRSRRLKDHSGYWGVPEFTQETQEMVESFFDIHNEAFEHLRFEYHKATGNDNIQTIGQIMHWCHARNVAPKITQTKEEKALEILQPVMYEWTHRDEFANQAIWFKSNDYVGLIIVRNENENSWGYGRGERKLFAYNVATKKRFYGECDSNNNWTFPIPSLAYIRQAMWLGDRTQYHGYNEPDTTSRIATVVKGDLSVRELFDKTNIAWILDNIGENYQIFNKESERYYHDNLEPVAIAALLDKDRIGSVALNILISTGIPVLEQLLKSRLFNLYFLELDSLSDRGAGGCSTEVLWDLDKKRNYNYGKEQAILTYHSKASNLKKMFGLNLNMLHIIDDQMCIKHGKYKRSYYSDEEEGYYRDQLCLSGLDVVIGTNIANLDPKTFQQCIAISVNNNRRHNVWDTFSSLITENSNMNPKQIIQYVDTYKDCAEELRDYLSMRKQLADIQSVKADIPDIFNEKRYPMRPTAAKRFIPYLAGMMSRYRWRRDENGLTRDEFYREYCDRYSEAERRGDLVPMKDDNGQLVGILIRMNPAENLRFLHDDASYWIDFYQDEAKNALFDKAIERVKKYEWKDKKLGLEIVAPTCIQDVKEEGHILSHCVASYVDPIIHGQENIMFLRRSDMPDHPFFTVEVVDGGKIRQVHCYRNGNPTTQDQQKAFADSGYEVYNKTFPIIEFLQHWAKAGKGIDANSVHDTYGALCAKYR